MKVELVNEVVNCDKMTFRKNFKTLDGKIVVKGQVKMQRLKETENMGGSTLQGVGYK